ncbi:hypothetical protein [Holdemania massiliensis]|uniref:hypothetical protein n=1 Tax=Holdemania massiliensis TaxID=1468449 RepID=UPI001F0558A3|nr:hypothetical protein [Holdemania massiliensis]MCH1939839.1 hypothetical protein [Holdemania massiliensis]
MKLGWKIVSFLLVITLISGCSAQTTPTAPGESAVIAGKLSDGTTYEANVKLIRYLNQEQLQELYEYGLTIEEQAVGAVQIEAELNRLEGRDTLDLAEVWEASFQKAAEEAEAEHESLRIYPGGWLNSIKPLSVNESGQGWVLISQETEPTLMNLFYSDKNEAEKQIVMEIPEPQSEVLKEDGELKVGEPFMAGDVELIVEEIKTSSSVMLYRWDAGYQMNEGEQAIGLRVKINNQENYDLSILAFSAVYETDAEKLGREVVAAERAEGFEVLSEIAPQTEEIMRFMIKVDTNTQSTGRLKLAVNGYCFGMDYTLGEELDRYPVYQEGDVIETPQDRLSIKKISTVFQLNPPSTTGNYTYLKADPDMKLYSIEGTYENLGSDSVQVEQRLGILWQERAETEYGWVLIPSGNDFDTTKTCESQQQCDVDLIIMLNEEQLQHLDKIRIGVGDLVVKGQ